MCVYSRTTKTQVIYFFNVIPIHVVEDYVNPLIPYCVNCHANSHRIVQCFHIAFNTILKIRAVSVLK